MPDVPQPAATVTTLRQAVSQIAPAALPAFTREPDQAADRSRQGSDPAPFQRFVAQWAVHVHVRRQPGLAADLRHWVDTARTGDADRARRAASEIGRILDAAHAAVGLSAR
ncbi:MULTISPECIES: hypothetical protein [Streptomyces]|uniref:hypothetical protein n=1 Tax=Streptomyces TaxID=1883 RepID=UPI001E580727|nr:hypothetical protein [Streptomyces ruber]